MSKKTWMKSSAKLKVNKTKGKENKKQRRRIHPNLRMKYRKLIKV